MKTTLLLIMFVVCAWSQQIPDPSIPGKNASKEERKQFALAIANQFAVWQKQNPGEYVIDPMSAAAQFMVESNWGRSLLSADAKNLGGIKGNGPAGSYNAKTKEVIKGKTITITDGFRSYHNFTEFYSDYRKIAIRMKAYDKQGKSFYQALKDAGYATDTNYVNLLNAVYVQITN